MEGGGQHVGASRISRRAKFVSEEPLYVLRTANMQSPRFRSSDLLPLTSLGLAALIELHDELLVLGQRKCCSVLGTPQFQVPGCNVCTRCALQA
eukprot:14944389-Heterocapsa_arctica.AAC.1